MHPTRRPAALILALAAAVMAGCAQPPAAPAGAGQGPMAGAGPMMGGPGPMRGPGGMPGMGPGGPMHGGHVARADLAPTRGHQASGTVMFHTLPDGVFMHARISGLKPGQAHGFHIHEKGDCSSGDGSSAGGHFNPGGQPHGPQHAAHHAGDLPALQADANGRAELRVKLAGLTVGSGTATGTGATAGVAALADIVGRGLIVHADPDDYATQPTGNSGARIACAVITAVR